jgi:hypothetical protein
MARHESAAGLSRPPQYPANGPVYRAVTDVVQELENERSRSVRGKVYLLKIYARFQRGKDGQVRDSGCSIGWPQ